jgi:hypothetical protein
MIRKKFILREMINQIIALFLKISDIINISSVEISSFRRFLNIYTLLYYYYIGFPIAFVDLLLIQIL